MEFEVRQMAGIHISDIADLEEACFSEPWSEEGLKAELSRPEAVFRVALAEDIVLGYAGMHNISGEGYITNIAVWPKYRRKGVADRLLAAFKEYGRLSGMIFITLEVRPSNAPACRFYEKEGFRLVGRRKNFYRSPIEDALLLTYDFKNTEESI